MLEESRAEFLIRWHLYRRWQRRNRTNPIRQAEYTFHKMMGALPKGVFLDLGANVGMVTGKVLEYGYDVIAFEPDPSALAQLTERFGDHPKVRIIPKAVGASNRRATFFHLPSYTVASSLIMTSENAVGSVIEVEVVNLIDFIKELGRPVAGIKMDIEGAEAECLEALLDSGLHHSIGYILVECHDRFSDELHQRIDTIRQRIRADNISNINLEWI